MRKSFLIFVMTSLLLSLCNTVSAQQPNSPVDIAASAKTVADSVAQITLPVSLPVGETIESFLLKHDVYKDEEENYFSQFFGEKKKMIAKDVEFWLVYWAVKDSVSRSKQQASSQGDDIKCVADTEFVSDLYFHLNDTVTMPIGQAELDRVGDVLLKLPGVSMDDNGDVFIEYRYKTKVSMVYFNGDKEIKFICPDYSLVLLPPGPLDPNVKYHIGKMDGKGSRLLTPEEMREYGLIGIPIPLPEGETVESYLLKQPGVHKDEEGNIIYPNGRKLTPEEIELSERDAHISWQDSLLKYQQKYQQQNK